MFAVGPALLGLQRLRGSGRGIHHRDANSWAICVLMSLCWSLRCKASLWWRHKTSWLSSCGLWTSPAYLCNSHHVRLVSLTYLL